MSRRAVILAGGLGTRLRPFTLTIPKPLVPIGSRPVLDIVIQQLAAEGFEHITLAISAHTRLIRAFFGDGKDWNVNIDYSLEDQPLSTMGPLKLIGDLPENFLVMNGDILTDLAFDEFYRRHAAAERLFTIASHRREQSIDYGVLHSEEGRLVRFEEKPKVPFEVSMGIYMLNRRVLSFIPEGVPFGFDDLMRLLMLRGEPVFVEPYGGYWKDIGRPDDYESAVADNEAVPERFT
ncbi:sugar phosphate nucleotidyltransferase [Bradyrhizobium sp. BR 10261]|uniref:nucleotidyltransferase family protein n=1 Tax=Bradyrhizobium sp. BR 10261 TaxID=2749992 RepID=UPI001C6515A1|nr:sugar phosphate nucleotidyltransferase [Bradyrhizobium sp. BR 10261]MBW7961122.1 NTP transferase domain-containing protein [Bradyrhizobium sp. BR 10261]